MSISPFTMNLVRFAPLGCLALVAVCLARPPMPADSKLSGDRIDVDINGTISILNTEKNSVTLLKKDRVPLREIGGAGWENNQFDRPSGIWARNGIDVFVADYGNHRIQRFDRNLSYVSTLYTREDPDPDQRFGYPADVAVSRLGFLFICDTENSRIAKINQLSQVERTFGGFSAGEGRLYSPSKVECGPADRVYVVDGPRLMVYDNFGNFLHALAGVFHPPLSLYASDTRVVVVDSSTVYCFNGEERAVCTVPAETVFGVSGKEINAIAFSRDSMFAVSREGLLAAPDPVQMMRER